MSQTPSVGRVVHYVARGSADGRFPPACRAATITEVGAWDTLDVKRETEGPPEDGDLRTLGQRFFGDAVGLAVHNPTGMFFHSADAGGVHLDEGHEVAEGTNQRVLCDGLVHTPGSWHWPGRV